MRAATAAFLLLLSCGDDSAGEPLDAFTDARPEDDLGPDFGPPCTDTDGDGIIDRFEGTGDRDEDGIPNHEDLDSDGDGIPDEVEAGDLADCSFPGRDTDFDGWPDHLDFDSDGDGVLDADEGAHGFDPTDVDTDRDGCPDSAELIEGACDDPRNAFLTMGCGTPDNGSATFLWSGDAPLPVARLTLTWDGMARADIFLQPQAVVPADGATLTSGDEFEQVQPGARITFELVVGFFSAEEPMSTGTLTLVDGEGATIDMGRVYVFGRENCSPVLI